MSDLNTNSPPNSLQKIKFALTGVKDSAKSALKSTTNTVNKYIINPTAYNDCDKAISQTKSDIDSYKSYVIKILKDISFDTNYKDIYFAYKTNPTEENKNKLIEKIDINHSKIFENWSSDLGYRSSRYIIRYYLGMCEKVLKNDKIYPEYTNLLEREKVFKEVQPSDYIEENSSDEKNIFAAIKILYEIAMMHSIRKGEEERIKEESIKKEKFEKLLKEYKVADTLKTGKEYFKKDGYTLKPLGTYLRNENGGGYEYGRGQVSLNVFSNNGVEESIRDYTEVYEKIDTPPTSGGKRRSRRSKSSKRVKRVKRGRKTRKVGRR
jgi:hypothetical protein